MKRITLPRALRLAALVAASSVVLVALLMAGLWWWAGTEGSLDWTLKRVTRSQPMQAEGVRGSLRSGLEIDKLVWEQDGLRIEAHDVRLEWQPTALVTRTVQLEKFSAALLRVIDQRPPTADPMKPPATLELPMRIKANQVAIAKVDWQGRTSAQAQQLAGAYAYDGLGHQLRVDNVQVAGGRYRGEASLGVLGTMPFESTVQGTLTAAVPRSDKAVPLTVNGSVRGPLADLRAHAVIRATQPLPTGELPQATATARVTPFAAQPVPEAQAELQHIDLASLWPQAPRSSLSGRVTLQPAAAASNWNWRADLRNAVAAPWDRGGLPLQSVKANGEWRGAQALVESLQAQAGGGELKAKGQWRGADGWSVEATLEGVDPAQLHTLMAPQPVGGQAHVSQQGEVIEFDVDLRAQGRAKSKAYAALELRQAKAQGRWSGGTLSLPSLDVRASDASLTGSLDYKPTARAGSGRVELQAPGLNAKANGSLSESAGSGRLQVDARNLAQAQRWLQRVPFVGDKLPAWQASGQAALQTAWQGGWRDPALQASLTTTGVEVRPQRADPATPPWALQQARASVNGRLSDARIELAGRASQGARSLDIDLAGRGGRSAAQVWRVNLPRLRVALEDPALGSGAWRAELQRPLDARWLAAPGRLELAAGEALLTAPRASTTTAQLTPAVLTWQPTRWGGGELQTAGRITGLTLGWIELVGGGQLGGAGLSGNMAFDAQWNANIGRQLRLDAALVRTAGDVNVLAEQVTGGATRVAAGVRDARITLQGQGEHLTMAFKWDSERAGTADARILTRLEPGGPAGWHWPENAPIDGFVRAHLPRIGVWSLLAPPGWRLRGSLDADVRVAGMRSDPRFSGALAADDLALRSVVEGVELRNGRMRARLDGQRLHVDEFILYGAGEGTSDGWVKASGEGWWSAQGPQLNATAQLQKLRASIRSDRDLTVSGQLAARIDKDGTDVRGKLRADQARIVLPEELPPQLDDDVVVRRAEGRMATAEERKQREPDRPPLKRAFNVAVDIDMGEDFHLRGRGLDTRLRGTLALTGDTLRRPRLTGTITTASGGEYRAYGQRLDIERGVLRFTGALDNPSLDILAIRPHTAQRVGVMISGTVQSPYIRLHSEPELPDAEKLTWLVTGRAAPSGGAEAALVQQAAWSFLAHRRGGSSGGVAGRVGLDELSVRRDDTQGAIVTLGKRFARNFYAAYERSLSGALGTLYVFYDISRRLTLRAETGERTAVDLIFTFHFDRARP
jgi:translocation and assembly module TamB